jgi:hypothetical protein
MAITTMDGLVSALGTAQTQHLFFPSATNVAGGWINLNQAVTSSFGIMAVPTAFGSGGKTYNRTSETTGFPRFSNPGGANSQYIAQMTTNMATAGTVHIYDLCWAASGFSGTSTTAQSVVGFSGLPTRHSTGEDLEIWLGCSSATGATASNITVQYTNSAGTSGRNTVSTAMITSMPANRMLQLPLQSGDNGVQSIQSLTLSASTATAGNLWLLLVERYASVACPVANVGVTADFASLAMPKISAETTPLFIHQGTTTSSGIIMGIMSIVEG